MSHRRMGEFSSNLFSLQLQIKTLLEGAGGDEALELLDTLCELNRSERKIALNIFNRTLKKLTQGEIRLETIEDKEENEFTESLYQDLVHAMNEVSRPRKRRLEVVTGGKQRPQQQQKKTLIDLDAARRERKTGKAQADQLLN